MSGKWPGGFINKTAPTVVGPVDGEGGTASGIWTLDQAADYEKQGLWPKPILDRELYTWGSGSSGALGQNNTTNYSSPVQVGALITWEAITQGSNYSIAYKTDGTMWSLGGLNSSGQLGQNNTAGYSSPVQIGALTNWTAEVKAGLGYTAAIKTDGTLWAWGAGTSGSLGQGNTTNQSSPVQVGALTTWSTLGTGAYHCASIKTDGTLWTWGMNAFGSLGLGNTTYTSSPQQVGALTNWSTVAAGYVDTVAVKTDGTLWSWGNNNVGQLGLGNTTNYSSPVQVGALTTWLNVACGYYQTLAIKTDGTLWAWGKNTDGQLGLGDTTNRSSPVQVGALATWSTLGLGKVSSGALKTDGTLWTWGYNAQGQLGLGDITNRSSPVQVGALTAWVFVKSGSGAETNNGGITKS